MAATAHDERTRWRRVVMTALAMLLVANVMSNRVLPAWAYLPWNVVIAAGLVWVARPQVSVERMGFTRWRSGAAWGAVLFVLTVGVLLLGLAMPTFHEMYHDRRVDGSWWAWAYQVFIRIPFGTALLEETAFRAVLPALFAVRWGAVRGYVAASVCFGVWHVLPALGLNEVNPVMTRWFGTGVGGVAVAVVFAVAGTTVAGLWWCWVRHKSGSVLATVLGHVASNSVAYTIAFMVNR